MEESEEPRLRRCGRCAESKEISNFNWRRRGKGQYDNYCRPCRAAYKREHYLKNRDRYIEQAIRRRAALAVERYSYLVEFFKSNPCMDCGETDPVVLEFDHLGEKLFDIGQGIRDRNWQSLLDEMAKCEVVCANCHRKRTAARAGSVRAAIAQG